VRRRSPCVGGCFHAAGWLSHGQHLGVSREPLQRGKHVSYGHPPNVANRDLWSVLSPRGRPPRARSKPKLEVNLARPDGTLLHVRATDADAGVKALAETLATTVTDPAAREKLLRIAAGADPSTALPAPTTKSQATAIDAEGRRPATSPRRRGRLRVGGRLGEGCGAGPRCRRRPARLPDPCGGRAAAGARPWGGPPAPVQQPLPPAAPAADGTGSGCGIGDVAHAVILG
jgi:hypothetical protein